MQLSLSKPAAAEAQEGIRRGYQTYVLVVLMLVQALSYLDRTALNILVEPIRHEFNLTDQQIGALLGVAFALLYALMGIPIARIAEHVSRPRVIGVAVALWSAATLSSGVANSFAMLALSRLVLGIGEGGCTPAAHSLICEIVPRERRASGLALYSAGISIGTLLGLSLGGLIADSHGWRAALLCAGAPGLLLALIVLTTIPEPRDRSASLTTHHETPPAWPEALREILSNPVFWLVALGAGMVSLTAYARGAFISSFYVRTASIQLEQLAEAIAPLIHHHLGAIGLLGPILGISGGICGLCGALFGGWITDRLARQGLHAYATVPLIACLLSIPFNIAAVTAPHLTPSLLFLSIGSFINPMALGATFAAVQSIVTPNVRATASAVLLFTMTIIGSGLGPLLVGTLSDHFANTGLGKGESLRWALIYVQLALLVSGMLFWSARRRIGAAIVS
jgi:predicted MFS family arabinose efflux permease